MPNLISPTILAALVTVAAVYDIRTRKIPNILSWFALAYGLVFVLFHWWGYGHLLWALGTWVFFELILLIKPGAVGYGDVKLATVIVGFLTYEGVLVILTAQLISVIWHLINTASHRHAAKPKSPSMIPWAVSAWGGLLATFLFVYYTK